MQGLDPHVYHISSQDPDPLFLEGRIRNTAFFCHGEYFCVKWRKTTHDWSLNSASLTGLHNIGNLVIKNFELYKIDASNNPQADPGTAYIDPNDVTYYNDSSKEGAFIKLERGSDYAINEDLGFIRIDGVGGGRGGVYR